jgi:hypothetical protein
MSELFIHLRDIGSDAGSFPVTAEAEETVQEDEEDNDDDDDEEEEDNDIDAAAAAAAASFSRLFLASTASVCAAATYNVHWCVRCKKGRALNVYVRNG